MAPKGHMGKVGKRKLADYIVIKKITLKTGPQSSGNDVGAIWKAK